MSQKKTIYIQFPKYSPFISLLHIHFIHYSISILIWGYISHCSTFWNSHGPSVYHLPPPLGALETDRSWTAQQVMHVKYVRACQYSANTAQELGNLPSCSKPSTKDGSCFARFPSKEKTHCASMCKQSFPCFHLKLNTILYNAVVEDAT